jgi:hypothetical protein
VIANVVMLGTFHLMHGSGLHAVKQITVYMLLKDEQIRLRVTNDVMDLSKTLDSVFTHLTPFVL